MLLPRLAALALCICCAVAQPAAAFTGMTIFGDSLSDTGNIDQATGGAIPGSGYDDGRFSNGPVWVDYLAQRLGMPAPVHDLRGFLIFLSGGHGNNYAVGGALTSDGSDGLWFDDIDEQVERYLDDGPTPTADGLFVLLGGANNINDSQTDVGAIASDLVGEITTLYNAGARHVLVSNLPPIGLTPGNVGTSNEALKNNLTSQFNAAYAGALDALELARPQLTLYRMDLHRLTQDLLADPARFGFTNITQPAMDTPGDDDAFAFWDDIHPTTRFHKLIADAALFALTGPLTGDANNDGVVDAADLLFTEHYFGRTGPADGFLWGDANDDGRVDARDYLAVQRHFGATFASPIVPEPTTAALLLFPPLMIRRRNHHRSTPTLVEDPPFGGRFSAHTRCAPPTCDFTPRVSSP